MRKRNRTTGWPVIMLALVAVAGLIGLMAFLQPAPASADEAKYYLDCPTAEVREGGSVDVYLVRVTDHQHDVTFGAYWHTDAGTAGTDDYDQQNSGSAWANDSERAANRAKRTFQTRQDSLVEESETFTARTDSANIVDRNDPTRDEKCEITIIDDDPNITEVEVTSSPGRDDTYGVGETIEISATFSTNVDVDGTPSLGLWVGGTWKAANYRRGSGTDTLVFGYTVKPEDRDANGISMDGGYQDRNGTWHNFVNHTAVSASGVVGLDGNPVAAYRIYRGLEQQSGHKVDGNLTPIGAGMEITSEPADGDSYRFGETIDIALTLSAPVDVEGPKNLNARVGDSDTWRGPVYRSGTGTNTLVFEYTVQTRDLDTDGISIESSYFQDGVSHCWGGSGTVKVKGTDVVVPPAFTGLTNQSDHNLDGRPYPTNIAITSTPIFRVDVYGEEEIIQVRVKFDQNVTVGPSASGTAGGDTQVALFIGAEADERPLFSYAKPAFYVSGSGTDTLFFEYRVEYSDRDINGVAAALPWVGNIKATGTEIFYRADLDGVLDENPDHKVDGSLRGPDTDAPTISSISITSDPGGDDTYVEDDSIEITVTFSEDVTVTGTPQLEVDLDGAARAAGYSSSNGSGASVVFEYTVVVGDRASDGLEIRANKLTLNGGAIQDASGNDATLTHPNYFVASNHFVNGTGGV